MRVLGKASELTRVAPAHKSGTTQDGISCVERRSDLLLSTMQRTVEATYGNLSLIASFPDRAPVELSGISEADEGRSQSPQEFGLKSTPTNGWSAATPERGTDVRKSIPLIPDAAQTRGILWAHRQVDAVALAPRAGRRGLDVLLSRGIPDAGALVSGELA